MRVPEFLFPVINPIMKAILRSPLHPLFSGSVMLITFTGRRSGRQFTTPVRYMRTANGIRCFSADHANWWRNLRGGAVVTLRIAGKEQRYRATLTENEPAVLRQLLTDYLQVYPQDAVYHEVRRNRDKSLVPEDLDRAALHAVSVEAIPLEGATT